MTRRVTPAQYRSLLQQAQNRRRQAVDNYNRAVRDYNRKASTTVDTYNREVRAHNSRVRVNRQRDQQALSQLQSRVVATRYVQFRASVTSLHESYVSLDRASESRPQNSFEEHILELSEKEDANSLEVMNALLADEREGAEDDPELRATTIGAELGALSEDLHSRWRGALYALHPQNPDASRHFCSSAREIMTGIIDQSLLDAKVKSADPSCPLTSDGRVTRRAKIEFALAAKGTGNEPLADFVHQNVDNVLELFRVFNDGAHGSAGRFDLSRLAAIKRRAEDSIKFLLSVFGTPVGA